MFQKSIVLNNSSSDSLELVSEDASLGEFLEIASEDVIQACEFAGLGPEDKIASFEGTDQAQFLGFPKLKDFGKNTSVYQALDGKKFVYHYECGIGAFFFKS